MASIANLKRNKSLHFATHYLLAIDSLILQGGMSITIVRMGGMAAWTQSSTAIIRYRFVLPRASI